MTKNGLKVVAALAALGVAGCGGGDSNKALSYSDFSTQANDICKSENAKIKPVGDKLTGKATTDAPVYDALIPKLQDARDKIGALKAPDALKPSFDSFLSITDQQIAKAKEAQTAAKTGNDSAYIAVLKATQPLAKQSDAAGSKLGAADCAKG
jgi:hypothetical protein